MKVITKLIRIWFEKRFGKKWYENKGYYKDWLGRWKNHCFVGNMDARSRRIWLEVCAESDFGRVIHKHRGVPEAYLGQQVEVDGKHGMIVGWNSSCNLEVYFGGGGRRNQTLNCHPNWRVKYKAFEKVVREFGD